VAQVKFTEWTADGKLAIRCTSDCEMTRRPRTFMREDRNRLFGIRAFEVRRLNDAPQTKNDKRRTTNEKRPTTNDQRPTTNLLDQLSSLESTRKDGVLILPTATR